MWNIPSRGEPWSNFSCSDGDLSAFFCTATVTGWFHQSPQNRAALTAACLRHQIIAYHSCLPSAELQECAVAKNILHKILYSISELVAGRLRHSLSVNRFETIQHKHEYCVAALDKTDCFTFFHYTDKPRTWTADIRGRKLWKTVARDGGHWQSDKHTPMLK